LRRKLWGEVGEGEKGDSLGQGEMIMLSLSSLPSRNKPERGCSKTRRQVGRQAPTQIRWEGRGRGSWGGGGQNTPAPCGNPTPGNSWWRKQETLPKRAGFTSPHEIRATLQRREGPVRRGRVQNTTSKEEIRNRKRGKFLETARH